MTREAAVRRQVVAYLKSLAPRVAYRSNPASPFAVAGDPDIFACLRLPDGRGQLLAIELKAPGGRLSDAQVRRLAVWAESGAVVVVAYGRADVETAIEGALAPE